MCLLIEDGDTWTSIVADGTGFIYNDFGTQFSGDTPTWNTRDFNKLHKATCPHVNRMTYLTEGKLTKHFFESMKDAIDWLEKNRKSEGYTFCTYCNP